MKLELKHLAPYLPYGLNGYADDIKLINGIDIQNVMFVISENDKCKPIFTQLSELSTEQWKEVLESGLDDDTKKFFNGIYDCNITVFTTGVEYDIRELISYDFINSQIKTAARKFNHLNVFNKLFELHADVYGLIEAGLAINKNTIKELVP